MKILLLCLLALPALAQDFTYDKETGGAVPKFVGELKVAKGTVTREAGGDKDDAKVGTRFYKDDILRTGERSFAQVLVFDETKLSLGPNSELRFASFAYKSKNDRQIDYSFVRGQLRALIKNKAKDGDLKFTVPNAVLGVRGTELLIDHRKVDGLEISEFALLSGKAEVKDFRGQAHRMKANDRLTIVRDPSLPGAPAHAERRELTKDEIAYLGGEETFLPFSEGVLQASASPSSTDNPQRGKPAAAPSGAGSFENIRKLNQQLEDDTKRRKGL